MLKAHFFLLNMSSYDLFGGVGGLNLGSFGLGTSGLVDLLLFLFGGGLCTVSSS